MTVIKRSILLLILIYIINISPLTADERASRVDFAFSPLAALSTSPHGGWILYNDGEFSLNPECEYYLQYASWEGFGVVRVLPYAQWWVVNRVQMFTPFYFNSALKSWDLNKWNSQYWKVTKQFIDLCNKYGLKVMFCIFDSCGFHSVPGTAEHRHKNPFWNNINGVKHYINNWNIAEKYINKCLDEFNDYDMMWEFSNEYCCYNRSKLIEFANKVFAIFKSRNIPASSLTYGAHMQSPWDNTTLQAELKASRNIGKDSQYGELGKYEIYKPIHSAVYKEHLEHIYHYFWLSFYISDDGDYWNGHGGCDCITPKPNRFRPIGLELYDLVRKCLMKYKWHTTGRLIFEHCPKNFDISCQGSKLKNMVKAYYEFFKVYPENWHKYTFRGYIQPEDTEPENPDPIEPDMEKPEPKPVKESINWNWTSILGIAFLLGIFILLINSIKKRS